MNSPMIVLLAGGDSTRFWPFSDKMGVAFLGHSLIHHTVEKLRRHGFRDITVVGNANNLPRIRSELASYADITVQYVEQTDPRGMAGGVKAASKQINGRPTVIISPSDIYEDSLYQQLAQSIAGTQEHILCSTTVPSYFPGGYLQIQDGYVRKIEEKPDRSSASSNIVALVCDYFSDGAKLLAAIDAVSTDRDDVFEQAIQHMIDNGERFRCIGYDGFWGYLKYSWHILRVSGHYLSTLTARQGNGVQVHPTAVIEGEVVLEDGVRVMEHAKISGPAYIGKQTIIGNGTMIRESMIGASCVVGFGTEITRSYIGNGCWFHKNYIGDSVLSDDVCFGAGAVTANYRFDGEMIKSGSAAERIDTGRTKLGAMIGKNVHAGVNAAIMPGVKIGSDSIVGSGVTLDSDLPDGSYTSLAKSSYTVQKNRIQQKEPNQEDLRKKLTI